MIKLTAAVAPRSGWSFAEWQIHYRERHGPFTASVDNFRRHGTRYVQNYAFPVPSIPDFPETDAIRAGVSELWFPNADSIRAAYAEPDYLQFLRTDELRFCNFENIIAGIGREEELFSAWTPAGNDRAYLSEPRFKIFAYRTHRAGDDRAAIQDHWKSQRAPSLIASYPFQQYVRRYVQTQMLDEDVGLPGGVAHDLIDEFFFDTLDDAVAFWTAYRAATAQSGEDERCSDTARLWTIFAQQHEVFGPLRGDPAQG